jgi:hypothetical protein
MLRLRIVPIQKILIVYKGFSENWALLMIKSHLKERAKMKSLPADVSAFLRSKCRLAAENEDTPQEPENKNRGRCDLCGRSKYFSTTIKGCSCNGLPVSNLYK